MGELLLPVMTAEPNRKKKDSSSFLARTQPIKSHGRLVNYNSPNFLFLSIKVFSLLALQGLALTLYGCRLLNSSSLLMQNKPIFPGEKSFSLFFFMSIFWWPIRGPEKTLEGSMAGEQTGAKPKIGSSGMLS